MTSPTPRAGDSLHRWLLIIAYGALIVAPMIAVGVARQPTGHSLLYTVGKNFALAGFTIVALQFILSARFQWIERPFGQDLLYDFHRAMAVVATVLIVLHPLLMAVGDGAWELIYDPAIGWEIWLGRIALVLVLLHVIGSSLRKALGVDYELWKLGHNISALVILGLAFVHSYARGGDFDEPFLAWYWPALLVFAAGTWLTSSVVRPALLRRRPWRVTAVERETHDTWTVEMEPPEGERPYDHAPGQFHFIVFRRGRGLPEERHHWTISSSPEEPRIRASTIKESGDFTSTIGDTRPGDEALVYGPYGRFSHALHPDEGDLVFVAGGIGITPMMSMLRYMHDTGDERRVRLVYTNQEERDIVFREEIDRIAASGAPRLEVNHMLEEPSEGWAGESGMLGDESMERLLGPLTESRTFYVCGPPPMMDVVIDWLRDRGVPHGRIHSERFEP